MNTFVIVFTLAWRNLWRNHRRTMIMITAVTVGVWAMIFMTAIMRGMVNEMVRDGVSALPGHVQVHNPLFTDDPTINNIIADTVPELDARYAGIESLAYATRVRVPAVVSSEYDSRAITLFGIDPDQERGLSFVADEIVAGRFLESAADNGIVIGAKLADTLDTEVGKRIVIMSQDPDNEVADRGFRIVGIFEANLESFEETMVFAGKKTTQKMLRIGDQVTEVAFLGDNYRDVSPLLFAVDEASGDALLTQPWYELNSYLGTMLGVMDGFVLVWVIVIFLALSFGLVNTLVMAVFERIREIGMMLALGMRPVVILGQIVVESLLLLLIGLAVGNLLAWASIVPLADGIDISVVAQGMEDFGASSMLYPQLEMNDLLLANVTVLVLGFFASLSPAWRASRYEPIEAITKN